MTQSTPITLSEVERFFVDEAALLDDWHLTEWLEFMAEDGRYLVPPLDAPNAAPADALFLVDDDLTNLRSRVSQLLGRASWAESPRSRTRRLITNFRILGSEAGKTVVTANFAVWRFQLETTDVYVGRYRNTLIRTETGLRWLERRAILDLEALRPHGKISFIL